MKKLNVLFRHSPHDIEKLGTLLENENKFYFEYDLEFIKKGINISPFKLDLTNHLQMHKDTYPKIFGAFDDSLPDGWGLLLMDRFFRKSEKSLKNISYMDRLSYISNRAIGALCYEPAECADNTQYNIDLYETSSQSLEILKGEAKEILPYMFKIGGSPGGARPKILVGYNGNDLISDIVDLPKGYEHWLLKFRSLNDCQDSAKIEYIYYKMAQKANLNISESKLFFDNNDNTYFGTKRFDRLEDNKRIHTHTLSNLLHSNFRYPALDYEVLIKVCFALTKNINDVLECFKVMVFNILSYNRDDHGKNFSFIMDKAGIWKFAPAYDLTFSYGINGEHSTSINGEGKNPCLTDIKKIAQLAGISPVEQNNIIENIKEAISSWNKLAKELGISKSIIAEIQKKHNIQIKHLN